MAEREEVLEESRRLRVLMQQTRLRFIESALSTARALCTIAEADAAMGEIAAACQTLERARRAAESAREASRHAQNLPTTLEKQSTRIAERLHRLELLLSLDEQ